MQGKSLLNPYQSNKLEKTAMKKILNAERNNICLGKKEEIRRKIQFKNYKKLRQTKIEEIQKCEENNTI